VKEDKEQYRFNVSNRFTTWKDLDCEVAQVWERIWGNIKITVKANLGYCQFKYMPWFDKGCSK
jgi:hypothetical protein